MRTKFNERTVETLLRLIRGGHTITDACQGACISTDTFYRWLAKYPDFNKAVVEATDLQWKYAEWQIKHRHRSYTRQLNRPSENYQSPGNLPFGMPEVDDIPPLDDDDDWLLESTRYAY